MRTFTRLFAAVLAAVLLAAFIAPPVARATVTLDGATFWGQVVPWLQCVADGQPASPDLELRDGKVYPAGGEWEAPGQVIAMFDGACFNIDADVGDVGIAMSVCGDGGR